MRPITAQPSLKFLCLSSLVLLGGCISSFQVEKIVPDTPAGGIQYSLPIPALQVCPSKDGSLSVEQIYLPDPNNTYAISAKSYLSKFELTVDRENGMLTKLSWNPDSTEVAGAVAEASGALAKAEFEAEAEAQKTAATKAEEARDQILAAEKAVRDAKAAVASAEAELAVIPETPAFVKERVSAKAAVAKAKAALQAALRELAETQQATTSIAGASVGPAGTRQANEDADKVFETVLGCALYIVEDTGNTVALQPVLMKPETTPPCEILQQSFKTSKKIDSTPTKDLKIVIEGSATSSSVVRPQPGTGALAFVITTTTAFEIAKDGSGKDRYRLTLRKPGETSATVVTDQNLVTFTPGVLKIRVDLIQKAEAGDYALAIYFKGKASKPPVAKSVNFKVER